MASSPITSWQINGETMETVTDFILGDSKSLQMLTAAMKLKALAPWRKSYDQTGQHIKSRDITLPAKVRLLSPLVAVSVYIPTSMQKLSLFFIPSQAFIVCRLFDDGHSDRCEVISHCGSDLHLPDNELC